jgi:hypothetical protein
VASARGSLVDTTGPVPFQWTGPTTQVVVSNLGSRPLPVTVSFRLRGNGDTQRTVDVSAPGGTTQRLRLGGEREETVRVELRLAPGTTEVQVVATGGATAVAGSDGGSMAALRLADLRVEADGVNAASLQQFASASPRSLR